MPPYTQKDKKKWQPPAPTRVGKKKKQYKGAAAGTKLPAGTHIHPPSRVNAIPDLMYLVVDVCADRERLFFGLSAVAPVTKCRLRKLRLERIKDYLLLEQEFIANQEAIKPMEERVEVRGVCGDG